MSCANPYPACPAPQVTLVPTVAAPLPASPAVAPASGLAFTGLDVSLLVLVALVLMVLGASLVHLVRRAPRPSARP